MKQIITSCMALLAALSGIASDVGQQYFLIDAEGKKISYSCYSENQQPYELYPKAENLPTMLKSKRIATYGDPKLLDIELVYDESEYKLEGVLGGDMSTVAYWYKNPEKKPGIQEIPSGIAGLLCLFSRCDQYTKETDLYVVAKDIRGLENGSKVVFDISDCMHRTEYTPVDEDGEELNLATSRLGNIVTPGKFESAGCTIVFCNSSDGVMFNFFCPFIKYVTTTEAEEREVYSRPRYVFYNDCGPDFMTGCYLICHPLQDDDITIIEMPVYQGSLSRTPSETTLGNSPSSFRHYEQLWTRSPYSVATYSKLMHGTAIYYDVNGTTPIGMGTQVLKDCGSSADVATRLTVCANPPESPGSELLSMLLCDYMPETDVDHRKGFASWSWKSGKNGREYAPINTNGKQGDAIGYYLAWQENYYFVEDNYNEWLYSYACPNPHLVYKDSDVSGRLGNNSPIIVIMPGFPIFAGSDMVLFNYGLVGRYGEGNIEGADFLIENTYTDDYDQNGFRKEIFSYENILIDGETEGFVSAELSIHKGEEGQDYLPPSLTHLIVRDSNGKLTDRFKTAEEGVIEFYAGDFYQNFDWTLGEYGFFEYKCRPVADDKIKVEYAPYGSTNFTGLEFYEIPEKYFYPGYGNFYSAPLKDVVGQSANGWFDIRITLEDETGNKHIQTVSPAFKIGDGSGVDNTIVDQGTRTRTYFDLTGRKVNKPENGIFIEYDGSHYRKVRK